MLRPFEATMICKPTERSIWKQLKVNGGSRTEIAHFWHYVGKAKICIQQYRAYILDGIDIRKYRAYKARILLFNK